MEVQVYYSKYYHYVVDVPYGSEKDTYLVIQLLYVVPFGETPNSRVSCGEPDPDRPQVAHMMVSRSSCPSITQYDIASWWPSFACEPVTNDVDPYQLALSEWHQTIIIGNKAPLVAGRYYITLTGTASVSYAITEAADPRPIHTCHIL